MRHASTSFFFISFMVMIFALMMPFLVAAQEYVPLEYKSLSQDAEFMNRFDQLKIQLADRVSRNYSGKIRKKILADFEVYNEIYRDELKKGNYVYQEDLINYLNNIVDRIKEYNPSIKGDILVVLSRDPSLNAFCLPNGLLVVNLGLFYFLQNEEQLVGVIAHEIGHNLLRHGEKRIVRDVLKEESQAYKNSVRQTKRQSYNRSKSALNLIREDLYETGRVRRENEIEADSIGYVLFQNAGYPVSEFYHALNLMHVYDTIQAVGLEADVYKNYFDLPDLPFNEEWMKFEDFSDYKYKAIEEVFNEDSLRSHPEIAERTEQLNVYFAESETPNLDTVIPADSVFLHLSKLAEYEQISGMEQMEEYGFGIYLCLRRLQQEKDEVYYKKWLGILFDHVLKSRKAYTMNRYVDRVDSENQGQSYQQFLTFMWNLSYSDIESIAAYYRVEEH